MLCSWWFWMQMLSIPNCISRSFILSPMISFGDKILISVSSAKSEAENL